MNIEIKKFGNLLISRPAGKEAFLAALAYTFPDTENPQDIVIDFAGVNVLAPSWADEFLTPLRSRYPKANFRTVNTENPSVAATLKILNL